MKYDLSFNSYNEQGQALYSVLDESGFDPIGEAISLDDMFLQGHEININDFRCNADLISIILPHLDVPSLPNANRVLATTFKNYRDYNMLVDDLDIFDVSVSHSVIELGL